METKTIMFFPSQIKQQEIYIGKDEMHCNHSKWRLKTAHPYFKISSSNFNEHMDLKKITRLY